MAAVSNAGGLGVLAVAWLEIDAMIADIRQTKQLTGRPFRINLVLAFDYEANLERCLAEGAAVVFSSWGDPRPLRPVVARAGAVHVHACGPVAEAWTRRGAD